MIPEVAAMLRVCERTVYRLLASGQLKRTKVGRSTRITSASVRAYIDGATDKEVAA